VALYLHRFPHRPCARPSGDLGTGASKDPNAPFDAGHSWLLGTQRAVAHAVALVATVFLIAGGLGLWAHAGWWRPVAAIGLACSLTLMIVYFNPWFLVIEGVNAALIVGIVWPSKAMVGA
jgi:hypothetical protein